jgi:hypothetical protein
VIDSSKKEAAKEGGKQKKQKINVSLYKYTKNYF